MLKDLIIKSRSYRRFYQEVSIGNDVLHELVDLARLSPTGANKQALKFYLSNEPDKNKLIFNSLTWAGYLKDWPGPKEGERPSAYIIILGDKNLSKLFGVDFGIAAQSIMLGATEIGFGGCMIGNIKKEHLKKSLNLPNNFDILLVLALGKPKEKVVLEKVGSDGDIKYFRDNEGVHHVPKRSLDELIMK